MNKVDFKNCQKYSNDPAVLMCIERLDNVGFSMALAIKDENIPAESYMISVADSIVELSCSEARGLCYALGRLARQVQCGKAIDNVEFRQKITKRIAEAQYPFYSWAFDTFSYAGDWHDLPKFSYGSTSPKYLRPRLHKYALNYLEYATIRFERHCQELLWRGYNALTIADMLHAVDYDGLPYCEFQGDMKIFLKTYQKLYDRIMEIAQKYYLDVYFYTDEIVYPNKFKEAKGGKIKIDDPDLWVIIEARYQRLFEKYPGAKGVMVRLGEIYETDGFSSLRVEKYPDQAWGVSGPTAITKEFVKRMQDIIIEKFNKQYLHRTWDVSMNGVHSVPVRQMNIFSDIICDNFYVLTKMYVNDFKLGTPLNEIFGQYGNQIVEFQCKMEHNAMNDLPLFVGEDYARFFKKYKNNISGAWVWFYEGGFRGRGNYPYMCGFAKWTEANIYCISSMLENPDADPYEIIKQWIVSEYGQDAVDAMLEILRMSPEAVLRVTQDENAFKDMAEDGMLDMYLLRWNSFFMEQTDLIYKRNKGRFKAMYERKNQGVRDFEKMLNFFASIELKVKNKDLAVATRASLEHAVQFAILARDFWLIAYLVLADMDGHPVKDYDPAEALSKFNNSFKCYTTYYNRFDTSEMILFQEEAKLWLESKTRYPRVFEGSDDIFHSNIVTNLKIDKSQHMQ